MNRRIRMLGLALVAVLSMGVLGASGAQALQFTAASYPVGIYGEQTTPHNHVFTYQGRPITCEQVKLDEVGSYAGPTSSVKFTPTYIDCEATILGNRLPVTVTHNECVYNLTVGASLSGNSAHIDCPTGKKIQIHVYTDAEHKTEVCTYEVGSQTVGGITYSNMATDVTAATNSNVAATKFFGQLVPCGSASATATYVSSETTITATGGGGAVKLDVG